MNCITCNEDFLMQKLNYKQLKDYRKHLKLTLRDVEKLTGISNAYLSQIERGLRGLKTDTLFRLLDAYGLKITIEKNPNRHYMKSVLKNGGKDGFNKN